MEAQNKKLTIDRQTLNDLEIYRDKGYGNTVFEYLDFTITNGGKDKLKDIFRSPLSDKGQIIQRQETFTFIISNKEFSKLLPTKPLMNKVEVYFYSRVPKLTLDTVFARAFESTFYRLMHKDFRKITSQGPRNMISLINVLFELAEFLQKHELSDLLSNYLKKIEAILEIKQIAKIKGQDPKDFYTRGYLLQLDKIFRGKFKNKIIELIDIIHELDAFNSIAMSMIEFNLVLPEIHEENETQLEIINFRHILIKKNIPNSLKYDNNKNLIFLTGPNMGGKTTYMKSLGIAIYLAHLGMGVPAEKMRISVLDTLLTSLSNSDNVSLGYSYFYSEVLRVKYLAESVSESKKCVVLLDELFKGTNIKDAYDGNLMVIEGLNNWDQSRFIISSHITELAQELDKYPKVQFNCFDCEVVNQKPIFDYKVKYGISNSRIGKIIIQNENIPDILNPKTN